KGIVGEDREPDEYQGGHGITDDHDPTSARHLRYGPPHRKVVGRSHERYVASAVTLLQRRRRSRQRHCVWASWQKSEASLAEEKHPTRLPAQSRQRTALRQLCRLL